MQSFLLQGVTGRGTRAAWHSCRLGALPPVTFSTPCRSASFSLARLVRRREFSSSRTLMRMLLACSCFSMSPTMSPVPARQSTGAATEPGAGGVAAVALEGHQGGRWRPSPPHWPSLLGCQGPGAGLCQGLLQVVRRGLSLALMSHTERGALTSWLSVPGSHYGWLLGCGLLGRDHSPWPDPRLLGRLLISTHSRAPDPVPFGPPVGPQLLVPLLGQRGPAGTFYRETFWNRRAGRQAATQNRVPKGLLEQGASSQHAKEKAGGLETQWGPPRQGVP